MMILILAFIFGTVVGSFLNVCIYRIPEGESIAVPASHCRTCKRPVAFYDNIPLISFMLLKGKCRSCGTPLSWQYPLVELASGLLSAACIVKWGVGYTYAVGFLFCAALTVVTENSEFVAHAPKQVVEQMNERVRQFESALASLRAQHAKVAALPG